MRDEPLRMSAWEATGQTTKMRVGIVSVEQIETKATRVKPLEILIISASFPICRV